jgi:hypothetical protein
MMFREIPSPIWPADLGYPGWWLQICFATSDVFVYPKDFDGSERLAAVLGADIVPWLDLALHCWCLKCGNHKWVKRFASNAMDSN